MLRCDFLAGAFACAILGCALTSTGAMSSASAAETFTDPAKAGPEYAAQGEYQGVLKTAEQEVKIGAQLIALGDGKYKGVFYVGGLPGDGWEKGAPTLATDGATADGKITFTGEQGTAELEGTKLKIKHIGGEELGTLDKVERKSPTLGAKPPEGAKVLFDGSNADAWKGGKLVDGNLLLAGTLSKDEFTDFTLHLEFRTPFMPKATGQARGNSGLYLQNRYECQILDSFGLEGANNECGGFYQIKEPDVNMCYPPLAWQTYDVDFTGAKFEGDKKVKNAKVTIKHNGVTIHDNFELPNLTPGGYPKEEPGRGPFQLQAHGNPVAYRNIWVVEKK